MSPDTLLRPDSLFTACCCLVSMIFTRWWQQRGHLIKYCSTLDEIIPAEVVCVDVLTNLDDVCWDVAWYQWEEQWEYGACPVDFYSLKYNCPHLPNLSDPCWLLMLHVCVLTGKFLSKWNHILSCCCSSADSVSSPHLWLETVRSCSLTIRALTTLPCRALFSKYLSKLKYFEAVPVLVSCLYLCALAFKANI